MLQYNPATVNPPLPFSECTNYWQVLFYHHHAIATSLADLAKPAKTEPFVIYTFGSPVEFYPLYFSSSNFQMFDDRNDASIKLGNF